MLCFSQASQMRAKNTNPFLGGGGISYARTLQAIVVSSSTESIWDYSVGVGMKVVVLKLALMKPMGLQ